MRSRLSLPALACFATLVAFGVRVPTTRAQPSIRIRAESRIELRASWSANQLLVRAHLRDDLGVAIADAPVDIRVQPRAGGGALRRSVRTREGGEVDALLDAVPGSYRLSATFSGDAHHERVEVERDLDASRADVHLVVRVPDDGRIRLDVPTHEIVVRAESAASVAGLRVRLADELGRALATGETDPSGEARFRLLAMQLGPPSAGRLVASTAADATHSDALTEVPILRIASTRVSLSVNDRRPTRASAVRARGRLIDDAGRPLGREAIVIVAGDTALTTTLTDGDGRFDASVVPAREGTTSLVARFESDAPWRLPAESEAVSIEVLAPGNASTAWVLATLAATIVLLAAFGLRGRSAPAHAARPGKHAPKPGVEFGARRFRAARLTVDGVVLSLRNGTPLAGACVTLRAAGLDGPPLTCISDEQGRFQLSAETSGACALEVIAEAHESLMCPIILPHRGEWSASVVKLERTRDRALDALGPIARALLPERLPGTTTPREVEEAARARALPVLETHALTEGVERAGFAAMPPSTADLQTVERARDAVLAAVRRKPAPPDDHR